MYALQKTVVTVLLMLMATNCQANELTNFGAKACPMTVFDNKCVRCLAADGMFFSSDARGKTGKCVQLKQREKRTYPEQAEAARVCFAATEKTEKCASDYQEPVESNDAYVSRCEVETVAKSSLTGTGTTSFYDCDASFRTNMSTLKGTRRENHCKGSNRADCEFECQDIVLQRIASAEGVNLKGIEGDKDTTPCEKWLRNWDGTGEKPADLAEDAKATCEVRESWSLNNRTMRLGPDQACRFKVASTYQENTAMGEKTWLPGFDFGENEDNGVLVIVKDRWVTDANADEDFWTKDSARADTGGWMLLQGKVNGTVLSPGGRVPIGRNETIGTRQEWHVILINTRESVAPSNKQKSEHAAALKLWSEELAKAEEEKTVFDTPQPLIGDYGE